MEHLEKSGLSTPIRMPSQETFNTNMVDNFLSSSTAIYTPYSIKPNKSYSPRKVADQHRFWQKPETDSVLEQGYELVPELSYRNNLFINEVWLMILLDGAEFQAAHASVQFYPFG
jgi:hypothetical protein